MDTNAFNQAFFETLEKTIDSLPQQDREKLYRPCAVSCVESYVLGIQKQQFEECGGDMDLQYQKYGHSEFFFGEIIQPGKVYEIGYPRCLCPVVEGGYNCPAGHCECSRQSIIHVFEVLMPDRDVKVEMLHTVLTGASECRFRVTVGEK